MAYGKYGWPLAFLVCVFGLMGQELHMSMHKCRLMAWDYRWLSRSGFFVMMPVTFAMSIDKWAIAGKDFWGLSFEANQRMPTKTCFGKWECALPSFIVGGSFIWFILAITWFICSHLAALAFAIVGGISLGAGIWLAHYLKKGNKEDSEEDGCKKAASEEDGCKKAAVASAKPEKAREQPVEVVPTRPALKGYDPEDNVLAMISGRNVVSRAEMSSAQRIPPQKAESAVPYGDMPANDDRPLVKGLSLGAFDCPAPAEGYNQTFISLP